MIRKREMQIVDKEYFNIIQMGGFMITIQSKNTKHYWNIVEEEYPHFRHFKIYHKHNMSDEYHRHKDAPTLAVALDRIVSHDRYQMNGRKNIPKKQTQKIVTH